MQTIHKYWHISLTLSIIAMGLIFIAFEPYSSQLLAYRRSAILDGQLWRLITCHFHHTNLNHLMLNGASFIVITLLHKHHYKRFTPLILLIAIGFALSITLLITDPSLKGYLGLSGVLHGLFAWGAIEDIRTKEKTGYLLIAGLCIKLIWEGLFGPASSTEQFIGAKVLTSSHLYGAIWGTVLALLQPRLKL